MSKLNRFGVGAVVAVLIAAGGVFAGELTPPGPPGATMKTLQEIYDKQDATHQLVEALVSPQTLSATTTVVNAGYYQATDLTVVEPDLKAENIKKDVAIFGVTGTHEGGGAGVPRTGQTTSYRTGDDGDLEKGVAPPSPRFTDHGNGTVTDNLTGLMWVKAPHDLTDNSGTKTWDNAIDFCNGLTFAGHSDWRLPNVRELQSLIDYGRGNPALPSVHPFTGVQSALYWSSSTYADPTDNAWHVGLRYGSVGNGNKSFAFYVWPVRGGQ